MKVQLDHDPLVSVIIPVYNGGGFIADAITSALSQTYKHLEVLVVDDGSTDDTLSIVQRYAERDARVRVLVQPNGGVARARNRGIEHARGEYIAPLDADDLWDTAKIERQVERIRQAGPRTGFVYCWWIWIDEAGDILDRSPRWDVEGNVFDRLLQINFTGNASVPLFRRQCMVDAGGYNAAMADSKAGGCEDWEIALRIAANFEVAAVPQVLVGYRRRAGSMSTACATMERSHQMLLRNAVALKPAVSAEAVKASRKQFHLYLAGLAFWSGNLVDAVRWGLRSGWRLSAGVLPSVVRMLFRSGKGSGARMEAGTPLLPAAVPHSALLPYDSIYRRLWRREG